MAHPLVPQILELAAPVARELGLEVVTAVFQTNQSPPILRINVRNLQRDTGLDDCEQMSQALEAALDQTSIIPDAYVLEVSSPGVSDVLTSDREFSSFKGFTVAVTLTESYAGQQEWVGQLVQRDETSIHLRRKGRSLTIPRHLVTRVQLVGAKE
jgi:ribosome maturation factor RimP